MQTVLFHETIFGPIHSRRLGTSLGVNLMPVDGKVCTFDCLYCEAGYNAQGPGKAGLPRRDEVRRLLDERLATMSARGERLDVITFSGNGEPTIHPDFAGIIDDTTALRDRYYREVKISVLCNSTMLGHKAVADALLKVDNAILKLDSAIEATMRRLDRPTSASFTVDKVVNRLASMGPRCIVQTLITRGTHDGERVDNSTDAEIEALIAAYRRIAPREVMLYTIDRRTPEQSLEHIPADEMQAIGRRIEAACGIPVQVSA